MDRADLHSPACQLVLVQLFALMRRMQALQLDYSSWYGRLAAWPSPWEFLNRGADYEPWPGNPDELRIPWFLLWEIAWVVANTPLQPGSRVLDMGGAASLFACFLAARGHEVIAIDINPELISHTHALARAAGWRLSARQMDMQALDFPPNHFAHVFSLCVLEHLPVCGRVACSEKVAAILQPGGTASYTFDYANPQSFGRLDSPADVHQQIIEPARLAVRSNRTFHDSGQRYLDAPAYFGLGRASAFANRLGAWVRGDIDRRRVRNRDRRYTFGAVFLEKPSDRAAVR
ncbi:MAG: class I SAM-dependent methyltransferase [Phycisphaerae bacterium]